MSVTRRKLLVAATLTALVAAVLAVGTYAHAAARATSHARAVRAVDSFLRAWSEGRWKDARDLTAPAHDSAALDAASYLSRTASGLHASSISFERGAVAIRGGSASAAVTVHAAIRGLGRFAYDNSITLVKPKGLGWRVSFSERTVHPKLTAGTRLIRVRSMPQRGRVLSADGQELAPLDAELASNVVGSIGGLTGAQASALGDRADVGDPVGESGLERALGKTLAATAQGSVAIADARGLVLDTLQTYAGKPGSDVRTTFNLATQTAAERALRGIEKPAALVAIDTTTGAVTAIVDNPLGGFPRALVGPYAPGSTFKIVTSTAALLAGRTASTQLQCPKSIKVGGRTFVNAEDEELGTIPLVDAFAQSCNTAYAQLVEGLPLSAVADASRMYGFTDSRDSPGPLTIPGVGGFFPVPDSYARGIGQAIGQDQVVASPVQMASVAAAVAAGEWRQPYLLDPAPANLAHHTIPVASILREFMAAVVSRGTAKHAGLPAGTFGKTGTAEFGPGPPYKTHAWFVGFRGRTAFALIIEGGGFGGKVAAPVAARFLNLLG